MASRVGTRQLKTRLGSYLRLVRSGKTFVVTDRGRPVAELRPVGRAGDDARALLAELESLGEIRLPAPGGLPRLKPARLRGGPISGTLLEDRGDRA